jgi:hypothetical protein
MRDYLIIIALATVILIPSASSSQTKASTAAGTKIEPLRTLSGVMKDNRIVIKHSDWINNGSHLYDYTITKASIVEGHLVFTGSLRASKGGVGEVPATLVATSARSANPWPNAASSSARDRRPAAHPQQRERGEVTEQTQSLYSVADIGSGCELIFLKIQPPKSRSPLQVGVVLAHQDNEWGNQINQSLCRVVRAINAKEKTEEALKKLNQLISRTKG